jgi:hypothetical protein
MQHLNASEAKPDQDAYKQTTQVVACDVKHSKGLDSKNSRAAEPQIVVPHSSYAYSCVVCLCGCKCENIHVWYACIYTIQAQCVCRVCACVRVCMYIYDCAT